MLRICYNSTKGKRASFLRYYEENQAEQSAEQPANLIGYLQDMLAGSETRLMRGVVEFYHKS